MLVNVLQMRINAYYWNIIWVGPDIIFIPVLYVSNATIYYQKCTLYWMFIPRHVCQTPMSVSRTRACTRASASTRTAPSGASVTSSGRDPSVPAVCYNNHYMKHTWHYNQFWDLRQRYAIKTIIEYIHDTVTSSGRDPSAPAVYYNNHYMIHTWHYNQFLEGPICASGIAL